MDSLLREARYCMDAESCWLKLGAVRQELTNARNENSALKTQLVLYSENFQAERRDRGHRTAGAQGGVGQLEQGVAPAPQAAIEPAPEGR